MVTRMAASEGTDDPRDRREWAEEVLLRLQAVLHSLEHGAAGLIDQCVALVSDEADDYFLARLLAAHGADTRFLTRATCHAHPIPECLHALTRELEQRDQAFDASSLTAMALGEHAAEVPRFQVLREPFETIAAGSFDTVIVRGLPLENALGLVKELARLVRVGGTLELLETPARRLPEGIAQALLESAADLALGIRAACASPWRLSLVKVAGRLHEQPDEGSGDSQMLAHCRTRLEFVSRYVSGCEVLEAGCAAGIGARLFAERGARRVLALERSAELLQQARAATVDPRIEYRQADLNEPLPCASESFDVVVCTEVLEHIPSQHAAIQEFYRVLRPGGRLIVSVPDPDVEAGWQQVNRFGNPFHVHVPDADVFAHMLCAFNRIERFRQVDVVGTVVIPESTETARGRFETEGPDLTRGVRAVCIAVCTKGTAVEIEPRPDSLRLYRTFTDEQLRLHRNMADVGRDYVRARHRAWQAEQHSQTSDNAFAGAVEIWKRIGGVAVLPEPVTPGPWLQRLRGALDRVPDRETLRIVRSASEWTVHVNHRGEPTLLPRSQPTLAGEVHTLLMPLPEERVALETLWHWRRLGTKSIWFPSENGWQAVDADAAFTRRLFRKTWGRLGDALLPRRWQAVLDCAETNAVRWSMIRHGRYDAPEVTLSGDGRPDAAPWACWIAEDNAQDAARIPGGRALRVLQYSGALYCGGAERQLCNLTIGLAQRGVDVRLRTTYRPVGELGHYVDLLKPHGIAVQAAGRRLRAPARLDHELLALVPVRLHEAVVALAAEIADQRPDVLHCWLDEPNVIGGIAGLLMGVPRILLAVRNVNPTHFPRFHVPYMGEWYRLLANSGRVHFLSNSRAGAASYAEWLGIPVERFHLVPNGFAFDHFPKRTAETVHAARKAFGLSPDDRVVCGIFRLDDEKRPHVFLQVVRETLRRLPSLKILLAGSGPLEMQVRQSVADEGLDGQVQVLGRCADVGSVLLASDVMLLTSAQEGCPNVAIEAQYLSVPVVATRVGGTPETVLHGETGLLAAKDDIPQLAEHLARLLGNDAQRAAFARRAGAFARQRFDLSQMIDLTLLAYHRCFDAVGGSDCVAAPEPRPRISSGTTSFVERSRTPAALLTPPPVTSRPELTPAEEQQIEALEGHFHLYDAQAAHRLARLSPGPIVELGSYLGKSTVALLLGSARRRQRVVAVDPWRVSDPDALGFEHTRLQGVEDFLAFCRNVQAFRGRLIVHACRSRELRWDGPPIGALFIDSVHRYEEVRADFEHFLPFLRPDALVAFHDYLPENPVFPGVKQFIEEELLTSGAWQWDDYRGAFLTLRRCRRPGRKVVKSNQQALAEARRRYAEVERTQSLAAAG